jgi:hypothetical protein
MNPESAAPMVSNVMSPIGPSEVIVTREEPEQFRELFIQEEAPAKTVVAADQTLEGLPLKEFDPTVVKANANVARFYRSEFSKSFLDSEMS